MSWIVTTLQMHKAAMTTAALHSEFMSEDDYDKYKPAKNRERSVRNSLARALRQLEAAGTIRRDNIDQQWSLTEKPGPDPERITTSYHEAGHAVIGLQRDLPIGFAVMGAPGDKKAGYVTGISDRLEIGLIHKRVRHIIKGFEHIRAYNYKPVANLRGIDAFGNKIVKRKVGEAEHHGEVIMCIAGGMAEAIHKGEDPSTWRKFASSSDMRIAGFHRVALGAKAKSYEAYAAETLILIRKFWSMIEAVAAELEKKNFLSKYDIEVICRRVVTRQHLKPTR